MIRESPADGAGFNVLIKGDGASAKSIKGFKEVLLPGTILKYRMDMK